MTDPRRKRDPGPDGIPTDSPPDGPVREAPSVDGEDVGLPPETDIGRDEPGRMPPEQDDEPVAR